MSNNFQIIVFAKNPKAGYVKTRLNPPLDKNQSASLAESFLMDTINLVSKIIKVNKKLLYYYPQNSTPYFKSVIKGNWTLELQKGKNLGERITNAIIRSMKREECPVIVIGTDSPALPAAYISEALKALDSVDVVVGPCLDGGFYLVGVRQYHRGLFRNIRWSSEYVLLDTIQNINKKKLTVRLLPMWFDVDDINGLLKLQNILNKLPLDVCKNTRKSLKNLLINKIDVV